MKSFFTPLLLVCAFVAGCSSDSKKAEAPKTQCTKYSKDIERSTIFLHAGKTLRENFGAAQLHELSAVRTKLVNSKMEVRIEGHTPRLDSPAHEESRGQEIADFARDLLIKGGVPSERIETKSIGAKRVRSYPEDSEENLRLELAYSGNVGC